MQDRLVKIQSWTDQIRKRISVLQHFCTEVESADLREVMPFWFYYENFFSKPVLTHNSSVLL